MRSVYTLLADISRAPNDGLPEEATGASLVCYASASREEEAVHETSRVLKDASVSVLQISSYGNKEERLQDGHHLSEDELALMDRAVEENAVIVAQITPFFDDESPKS